MLIKNAAVPTALRHEAFVATPLTTDLAGLDCAAYMASPDVIRVHSDGRWPVDGFTLEEDRRLIAQHEADHAARRAFAFLLHEPSWSEGLGCLYLNPFHEYFQSVGADPQTLAGFPAESAMVTFWIRQDLQHTELTDVVAEAANAWLLDDWPLRTHLFRILPAEHASRAALERLDLRRVSIRLPHEKRPYLWYQPQ